MAQYLAKILLLGSKAVARAFAKAVQQEFAATQEAARRATAEQFNEQPRLYKRASLTLDEAKLILNVKDLMNLEDIAKKYDHLFSINEKRNGGSFYLQSKVYRAKERIDRERRDAVQRATMDG